MSDQSERSVVNVVNSRRGINVLPLSSAGASQEDKYISNCRKYGVSVDPSVIIALRTGWHIMQPTKRFCEGGMLPLADILPTDKNVKRLVLAGVGMNQSHRGAGNGNSNARILRRVLKHNTTIEELDLSNTGLDEDGIEEICLGLAGNTTVKSLNIARNHFGPAGVSSLLRLLATNETLQHVDLSQNAIGFNSIRNLRKRAQMRQGRVRDIDMAVEGNYVVEEVLNSTSHAIGFVLAVIGTILLMAEASGPGSTPYHFWSCLLFCLGGMNMFLSSTLYHSFFMLPEVSRILQCADHCAIYLLIAGSYTPFMLIGLHGTLASTVILAVEWVSVLVGVCFVVSSDLNAKSTTTVEVLVFVTMGLACVGVWGEIMDTFNEDLIRLLVAGGGAYIFGITFFILGIFKPLYHVVWHFFVMIGAGLHWWAIYNHVVNMPLPVLTATAATAAATAAAATATAAAGGGVAGGAVGEAAGLVCKAGLCYAAEAATAAVTNGTVPL